MHHGNSRLSIRPLIITMSAILAIVGVIIGLTTGTSHTASGTSGNVGSASWTTVCQKAAVNSSSTYRATDENVKALLDDWLPEENVDGDVLEYNPPIIPEKIRRSDKGLNKVWDWLHKTFGDDVERLPSDEMLAELIRQREEDDAAVYLVFIPGEDDDHLPVVKAAIEADIPVLDLTQGLADYEPPQDAEPPAEKPAIRRTRGKPRGETKDTRFDETVERHTKPADDDPPWDTGDEAESASKAPKDEPTRSSTEGAESPAAAATASPSANTATTLREPAIQALGVALHNFVAEMLESLIADYGLQLGGGGKGKPKVYPYYYNEEEGTYRPVSGRGRPKTGEKRVELTSLEIEEFGL